MAKRKIDAVTVRVRFPAVVYGRIAGVADSLGLDVPTFVRVLASAQLVQMEALTVNAGRLAGQNEQQVMEHLDREMGGLFADKKQAA